MKISERKLIIAKETSNLICEVRRYIEDSNFPEDLDILELTVEICRKQKYRNIPVGVLIEIDSLLQSIYQA